MRTKDVHNQLLQTKWLKIIYLITNDICKRSVGWVSYGRTYPLGFKSSTWHRCSHFPRFILWFNDTMLLVVGDVPIDSESPVVTSWISRSAGSVLRKCAHRGRFAYVCSYGRVCVRVVSVCIKLCNSKKTETLVPTLTMTIGQRKNNVLAPLPRRKIVEPSSMWHRPSGLVEEEIF